MEAEALAQGAWDLDVYMPASSADDFGALATSSGVAVADVSRDFVKEQQALTCLTEHPVSHDGSSVVDWSSITGVHWNTVEALARMGAVVVQHDEFGETQISLNPSGLEMSALHSVRGPVPICHVRLSYPPLQMPKLEWLLILCKDGFAAMPILESSWEPGSLLQYSDESHPVSYYAAMALRQMILDKGVPCIRHRFPDAYYKALILLPAAKLAVMLESMDGKNNIWFRKVLKDSALGDVVVQHPDELDPVEEDAEPVLCIADGAVDGMLDLIPASVSSSAWTRCNVSSGAGTPCIKIYFDFFTHSSGRQRGFVDCGAHGCRRYVFCNGLKLDFCAEMYLWVMSSELAECSSKLDHLQYKPDAGSVQALKPLLELVDF
jgi:hypothetical protein